MIRKIERAVFVIISVLMILLSIIAWVAVHQAGPPLYISIVLTLMPFAFIATTVDSLATLRPLSRLIIKLFSCLVAVIFLAVTFAILFGWERGDFYIPLFISAVLFYYNGRINTSFSLSK